MLLHTVRCHYERLVQVRKWVVSHPFQAVQAASTHIERNQRMTDGGEGANNVIFISKLTG